MSQNHGYGRGSTREKIWSLKYDPALDNQDTAKKKQDIENLSRQLGVSDVVAIMLANRGYTPSSAKAFLKKDAECWHSPFLMQDMRAAVTHLTDAVRNGETVTVYGDYDVDGVTSVAVLYLFLKSLGADVRYYIPSRTGDGYGMSENGVDVLESWGTSLIVTVDLGITASNEIAYAAAKGMKTIVTDHHNCVGDIPACLAVINPHRPDDSYPFKELAGVGVTFKLICAVYATLKGISDTQALAELGPAYFDLVSLGTVADVMPLRDENRFIVARGLTYLNRQETLRPGLRALLAAAGAPSVHPASKESADAADPAARGERRERENRKPVTAAAIGFVLAPRINAAGRIAHAEKAVELLLCRDDRTAKQMAEELCDINLKRQTIENVISDRAFALIESGNISPEENRVLVLDADDWKQGIVGIVSSRITDAYGLPSIMVTFDGSVVGEPSPEDIGKGSGRSVPGFNLMDALAYSKSCLDSYGGHAMAAGLKVRRANLDEFRKKINEYAAKHLTDDMTALTYSAECELSADDVNMKLCDDIAGFEPFGVDNPSPLFVGRGAVIEKITDLAGGKHLKLLVSFPSRGGQSRDCSAETGLTALWFGMTRSRLEYREGDTVDILFSAGVNEWRGTRSVQLVISDMRADVSKQPEQVWYDRVRKLTDGDVTKIDVMPEELPDRHDVGIVYRTLIGDLSRQKQPGHVKRYPGLKVTALREMVRDDNGQLFNPVKLGLCLVILHELKICEIKSKSEGEAVPREIDIEVAERPPKNPIEQLPLYRRLHSS